MRGPGRRGGLRCSGEPCTESGFDHGAEGPRVAVLRETARLLGDGPTEALGEGLLWVWGQTEPRKQGCRLSAQGCRRVHGPEVAELGRARVGCVDGAGPLALV